MSDPILYDVGTLTRYCVNLLTKAGLETEHAEIIAETLICAELRDIKSHGIIRLPTYMQRIEAGILNPKAEMRFEKDHGATALLDANNGFGQIAGHKAMTAAIEIAALYGIGIVGVRNSNHFGIASYYSMLALKKDMIGIVMTHASPAIAPFGTKTPLLGTNPLTVAIPASNERPIVLDMSMSTVARGKIRYSAMKNQKIPFGWGLDSEGNPTDDPQKALEGSLVPIGGVKGSGLALVVDILCGVLTNNSITGEVKNVTDMSGPSKTGHLFAAINISSFTDSLLFKNSIDSIIKNIKSLPPLNNNQIYMAGEIEYNLAEKRKKEGIPLDYEVINSLNKLADRYGASRL
jgi:LDH2 family malate/lactate/ureidoglycolate dehydrogenase